MSNVYPGREMDCAVGKKRKRGGGERDARQRESGGRLKAPFLPPPPLSALECKATPPPPPFTGIKAEEIRLENSFPPPFFMVSHASV